MSPHPAFSWPELPAPLAECCEVPLLGVPMRYRSNSAQVIGVVARAMSLWQQLPAALVENGPPAQISVIVEPSAPEEAGSAWGQPLVWRAHGDCVVAAGDGVLLSTQPVTGSATAFVTPTLAADEMGLRSRVIEPLGLLLAGPRDRAPLHAAAVVSAGHAIVLLGAPDELSYSCVEAGFGLLGVDSVYISLNHGLHLWGHPHSPAAWPDRLVTHVERATLCFVEPSAGQASSLTPLSNDKAFSLLSAAYKPPPWLDQNQAQAMIGMLTASGAHRLNLGADPASAVALLSHLAETVRGG